MLHELGVLRDRGLIEVELSDFNVIRVGDRKLIVTRMIQVREILPGGSRELRSIRKPRTTQSHLTD